MAMEKFHYKTSHGDIVIPRFKNLPGKLMRTTRKLDTEDRAYTLFEAIMSEEQLAILDEMTQEEQGELSVAWQKDSEVGAGE